MPNPFDSTSMAEGYARSRPPVHPLVIEMARPHLLSRGVIPRVLDVGCGAGLSTRAIAPLAGLLYGVEPALGMLPFARAVVPSAHLLAGAAEALPFRSASIDLITAAGSLNFVDLDVFFPEAARVLTPQGMLFVYDFSTGRSFPDSALLDAWFDAFLRRYPPVSASQARPLNPEILSRIATGFVAGAHETFAIPIQLEPGFYLDYVLTGTNVAAAVARGASPDAIRAWCEESLQPVWQGQAREVLFRGYWACLERVS